jgi:hypothetical protein
MKNSSDLLSAECAACGAAVFSTGEPCRPGLPIACPACAAGERLNDRLSIALALSILQSTVDEIAAHAHVDTAVELVPVLAELARLSSALAPTTDG